MVYDEMNGFMFSDAVNLSGFLNLTEMAETSESFDFILFAMCHVIKLRSKRPFRNIHFA